MLLHVLTVPVPATPPWLMKGTSREPEGDAGADVPTHLSDLFRCWRTGHVLSSRSGHSTWGADQQCVHANSSMAG